MKQNKGRIAVIIVCMLLAFGIAAGTMGMLHVEQIAKPFSESDLVEFEATVTSVRLPDQKVGETGTICTLEYGEKINLSQIYDFADVQAWESLQPGEKIIFGVWAGDADDFEDMPLVFAETVRTADRAIVDLQTRNEGKAQKLAENLWFALLAFAACVGLAIYNVCKLVQNRRVQRNVKETQAQTEPISITYQMDLAHAVRYYKGLFYSSVRFDLGILIISMLFISLFVQEKRAGMLILGGAALGVYFLIERFSVRRIAQKYISMLAEGGETKGDTTRLSFEDALYITHDTAPAVCFRYPDINLCVCGKDYLIVRTKAGRSGYIFIQESNSELKERIIARLRAENPFIRIKKERRPVLIFCFILLFYLILAISAPFPYSF